MAGHQGSPGAVGVESARTVNGCQAEAAADDEGVPVGGKVPWDQLDELVRLWVRDVRDASYDMEDIIDTLVREDDPEPTDPYTLRRLWKKMSNLFKKIKARHKITRVIQDINEKLEEVAVRRGRYTVDNIIAKPAASKTIDPRLLNLYKRVTELVGIEGPRNELIKRLSIGGDAEVSEEKMKIVSVVGFGGLGKTTLAKVVYDQLKPHFECRAFVSVGQNPDMKKVFRDILIDLDREKYMNSNMKMLDEMKLIEELKEFVQQKRCFIVIDDLWEKESWKLIRCALQDSSCGNRVMVTTRLSEVASHAGETYKMPRLSCDDSEKLLYSRIVDGDRKYIDSPSVKACDKILKKCDGVPLAIITIASLLASKPGENWSEIYNSIGFGHGDANDDVDNTRRILSFSYYDLSSHLKACLLYLSIFPEDYLIEKNGLVWSWIAEGFVSEEQAAGIGLFELGKRYFNDLINRSLIQPVDTTGEGYVDNCRVHDMVLDLVRSLSSQENFITVLDGSEKQKFPGSIARRLALQKIAEHNRGQLANMSMEKVRSLIARKCIICWLPPQIPVLRVLHIENCYVDEGCAKCTSIMEDLGSSLHLRYLKLSGISELPKKVGNLKFLQTLDLSETYIKELPEVGLPTQLVCLRTGSSKVVVRPGLISRLTSLQELWMRPDADSTLHFLKELGLLRDLRDLRTIIDVGDESIERDWWPLQNIYVVRDESIEKALLESLGNLRNIQYLSIKVTSLYRVWLGDAGLSTYRHLRYLLLDGLVFSGLPVSIKTSLGPNLSWLSLELTAMKEQDMETLGRLPELCFLELTSQDAELVCIKIPTGGVIYFRKLRIMKIIGGPFIWFEPHGCESNRNTSVAPTIMPSLESLAFAVDMVSLQDATTRICFHKLLTGFENLGTNSLERVTVKLQWRRAASRSEAEEVEDALGHAAAVHVRRPALETKGPYVGVRRREACMDARRTWKFANKVGSEDIQALRMPDPPASSSKVIRLLYTNNGIAVLALCSNAVHKLWKWKCSDKNPHGVSTTAVAPELWQRADGTQMINDTTDGNPEEATACNAISRNDGYTISASGGKVKLFDMKTFKTMSAFIEPPPAATFLAFHPEDNNIIIIGMDDSSIQIYNFRTDKIISKLMGHQKKITGVAFSLFMDLLVSSGADAQLCAWNIERWEKTKTTYIRPPSNCSGALVGDTMVHFDYDGKHLLVVNESQLAIYDGKLECLRSWAPRDALSAPISSAVYSSDGLLVYAGFYNGAIGIFEAESLRLQSRIASSAYIPASISGGGGSVYPMVVAAHPFKAYQFAVGMSDGAVYVLEPLDTDAEGGSSGSSPSEQGPDDDISSDGEGNQQ